MDPEGIRRSIESAVAYLTEHANEAAYTDSTAVARIDAGLRCRITGPNEASVLTDMPASVGGDDSAPSAGWLCRAAVCRMRRHRDGDPDGDAARSERDRPGSLAKAVA